MTELPHQYTQDPNRDNPACVHCGKAFGHKIHNPPWEDAIHEARGPARKAKVKRVKAMPEPRTAKQCPVCKGPVYENHKCAKPKPECPTCRETMVWTQYSGYYDSFCYWQCDCSEGDHQVEHVDRGSYG